MKTCLPNKESCTVNKRSVARMQLQHNASCQNCDHKTRIGCFCFCEVNSANCKSKASQLTNHYTCRFLGAKKRHARHPYRKGLVSGTFRVGIHPKRKNTKRKNSSGKCLTGKRKRELRIGNAVSENPYQTTPYRTNVDREILYRKVRIG